MLPPDELDSSSSSSSSSGSFIIEFSSSNSVGGTSLPTTSIDAATAEPTSSGMFAAILAQLRAELAEERRQRQVVEARQRELALRLCHVVDEQIRGVKAMRKLVQSVRERKEDDAREMVAVMMRMQAAWERKRLRKVKKSD